MPVAAFNMKAVAITAAVVIAALGGYIFFANFSHNAAVEEELATTNSGESTIEPKEYPKGFAEEKPTEKVVQQQQQPQSRAAAVPVQRADPPEPKAINLAFGKAEKPDVAGVVQAAAPGQQPRQRQDAAAPPDLPDYARQGLSSQKHSFAARAGSSKAYVDAPLQDRLDEYMIRRSRLIPIVMVNAPTTDQPGDVFAMVTQDIKDSLTGRCVLIPATSIVSGEVNDTVEYGASTGQAAWTGISIAETGQFIDLGSMPATNSHGRAGLHGRVNRHHGSMALALLGSVAVKLLGQAGQIVGQSGNEVTVYSAGQTAAASSVADPLNEVVTRELNRENTIEMEIGDEGAFLVKQDLYLPPQGECDEY